MTQEEFFSKHKSILSHYSVLANDILSLLHTPSQAEGQWPSEEELQAHINKELEEDFDETFCNAYDGGFHDCFDWLISRLPRSTAEGYTEKDMKAAYEEGQDDCGEFGTVRGFKLFISNYNSPTETSNKK